ncbi:hypothetical protein NEOKW01_1154 [Nematocida sp. AWRm80]|nr:hypothetical protein NEOKW01_1154 [Nematocida sp. AWRm80]
MTKHKRHVQPTKAIRPKKRPTYIKYYLAITMSVIGIVILHILSRKKVVVTKEFIDKLECIVSFPNKTNPEVSLKEPLMAFGTNNIDKETEKVYLNTYVIVQRFYGKQLVSSVFIAPLNYKSIVKNSPNRLPVLEVFNLYVNPRFRGKRASIYHLYKTIKLLCQVYEIDPEAGYIGLHISPSDKHMEKAYSLYRTSGFTKGIFTPMGMSYFHNGYELIYSLPSLESSINGLIKKKDTPEVKAEDPQMKYLTMFTPINEFLKAVELSPYTKKEYLKHYDKAMELRSVLESLYTY